MVHLAGIFVFSLELVTRHGVGEFVFDEGENLAIPPKADAATCEALQP